MPDDTEPVEIHICDTMVELALLRALFDHRQIKFSVDEDELGFRVCVFPADVERAKAALGDRGFGDEEESVAEDGADEEWGELPDSAAAIPSPSTELPKEAFKAEPQPVPEQQGYWKKLLRSWSGKKD